MAVGGVCLSEWMTHLPESVQTTPLHRLAIPGSHDSFAAELDKQGPITTGAPGVAQIMHKMKLGNKIVHRWSVTQSMTAHDQLNAGIRYFDIRTSPHPRSRKPCFVHGFFGPPLDLTMTVINAFLCNHPKEVVLLDFNTFFDMPDAEHGKFVSELEKIFRNKLCPRPGTESLLDLESLTLQYMWQQGWQVVLFYNNDSMISSPEPFSEFLWPRKLVPSPWPNQQTPGGLIKTLEDNYLQGRPLDAFYVTQGVLTPSTGVIVKQLGSSLKNVLCVKVSKPFVNWLQTKQTGDRIGINICIMDFVELDNFVQAVIDLNGTRGE